jgi:hypothetical protein
MQAPLLMSLLWLLMHDSCLLFQLFQHSRLVGSHDWMLCFVASIYIWVTLFPTMTSCHPNTPWCQRLRSQHLPFPHSCPHSGLMPWHFSPYLYDSQQRNVAVILKFTVILATLIWEWFFKNILKCFCVYFCNINGKYNKKHIKLKLIYPSYNNSARNIPIYYSM